MYRLTRFGTTSLDQYDQGDEIGAGKTPSAWQNLPGGGALDMLGDEQVYPGVVQRKKSLRMMAETEAELVSAYRALVALDGQRDRLYRSWENGSVEWITARCVSVDAELAPENESLLILPVDIVFETMNATWHGNLFGDWTLDSGEKLDTGLALDGTGAQALSTSPTTYTLSVGAETDAGRAPVRALAIVVDAGDAAMSAVTVARTGGETLTFGGTIAAGEQLDINCGTMQVTNGGVDAYNDLTLSPSADLVAWFSLLPGDNEITVTWTGGGAGAQIKFVFYESWR